MINRRTSPASRSERNLQLRNVVRAALCVLLGIALAAALIWLILVRIGSRAPCLDAHAGLLKGSAYDCATGR